MSYDTITMKPPYEITNKIISLIAKVSEKLGEVKSAHLYRPPTELRKKNRIKTIQSSLEIEGNTLTIEQITDLIDNKRVIGPQKDIIEVKNAIDVYSKLNEFNAFQLKSLCKAHRLLMNGLLEETGKLRTKSVGIVKGEEITHIAPPGEMVSYLMNDLFEYLKKSDDMLLVKSCVFHYEFEFIHPFLDGNGRMGRFWQTIILKEYSKVFEYLPIETLVRERQQAYYNVLGKSDNQGTSTLFIEFMLEIINDSLEELLNNQNLNPSGGERIRLFIDNVGKDYFTRQEYLRRNKGISPSTASRDLRNAVNQGILERTGDKRLTKYRYR